MKRIIAAIVIVLILALALSACASDSDDVEGVGDFTIESMGDPYTDAQIANFISVLERHGWDGSVFVRFDGDCCSGDDTFVYATLIKHSSVEDAGDAFEEAISFRGQDPSVEIVHEYGALSQQAHYIYSPEFDNCNYCGHKHLMVQFENYMFAAFGKEELIDELASKLDYFNMEDISYTPFTDFREAVYSLGVLGEEQCSEEPDMFVRFRYYEASATLALFDSKQSAEQFFDRFVESIQLASQDADNQGFKHHTSEDYSLLITWAYDTDMHFGPAYTVDILQGSALTSFASPLLGRGMIEQIVHELGYEINY